MIPVSDPIQSMARCTLRIRGGLGDQFLTVGTGFLYAIEHLPGRPDDQIIPLLITNKHVVEGCDFIEVVATCAPKDAPLDELGRATGLTHRPYRVNLLNQLFGHPSDAVDLCAINVQTILNRILSEQRQLQHVFQGINAILNGKARADIHAVEPIVMVGYPSGIFDDANNAPIVRRGITATHPLVLYQGRPEFVIDAACFPGSSGSPVFLFQDALPPLVGHRLALLGVLYAGPQFTATGKLVAQPIPHSVGSAPVTNIPMNLGYVIRAEEIGALERAFVRTVTGAV